MKENLPTIYYDKTKAIETTLIEMGMNLTKGTPKNLIFASNDFGQNCLHILALKGQYGCIATLLKNVKELLL